MNGFPLRGRTVILPKRRHWVIALSISMEKAIHENYFTKCHCRESTEKFSVFSLIAQFKMLLHVNTGISADMGVRELNLTLGRLHVYVYLNSKLLFILS